MPLFFLFVAVVVMVAPARAAEPKIWERLGEWTIFSSHTDSGSFETCFMQRLYPQGQAVTFFDNGKIKTLAFFLESGQLESQARLPVTVHGDATPPVLTYAMVENDQRSLALELEISPHLLGWTAGRSLHLDTGTKEFAFPISGARSALERLALCAFKNLGGRP